MGLVPFSGPGLATQLRSSPWHRDWLQAGPRQAVWPTESVLEPFRVLLAEDLLGESAEDWNSGGSLRQ